MEDIMIIGSGGLAKEIKYLIDAINKKEPKWNILGFIDAWGKKKDDEIIDDYKVIGDFNDLNNIKNEVHIIIAIGNPQYIKTAVNNINNSHTKFANLIHPSVEIDSIHNIGYGNIISFGSKISCDVKIGNFNFFNTMCGVGHDTVIGSYNVFNPRTQISGNVTIGNENFFGLNSAVIEKKKVGNNNKIGACSLIFRNIKDNESLFGIPATKYKF